jgi:hypothetical protein
MTSNKKVCPSDCAANSNDKVNLFVPRIRNTGPEPDLHVRSMTASPIVVYKRCSSREQHQKYGISPPSGGTSKRDYGRYAKTIDDHSAY